MTGSSEVNIMAPDRSGERPENVSMTSVQSTDDAAGNQKTTRRPRMKAILQKLQNQVWIHVNCHTLFYNVDTPTIINSY